MWGPCFGHKRATFWPLLIKGDYGRHPELWTLAWSIPGQIDYVCNSASFKWVEVQRKVLKMYRYIPTKNDKIIKLNGHISNIRYFPSRIQIYSFLKWTIVANCSNQCLSCWSACCLSPPLLLPWPSSHQTWCRCRDELASVSAAYVSPSTPKQSHNHGVFFVKTFALENYVAHDGLARSIANFPKLHSFHK